jgi:hypothetical protein
MERYSEREDNANCAGLDDGAKGFVIVYAMFLRETTDDPTGFVTR